MSLTFSPTQQLARNQPFDLTRLAVIARGICSGGVFTGEENFPTLQFDYNQWGNATADGSDLFILATT